MSYAYKDWCEWKGFEYEFERFKERDQPLPYIPFEKELDQLIAGFGPKYFAFLQLLKETGFRSVEARRLTPYDIDLERKVITLNKPAKNNRPRQFKISDQLISSYIVKVASTLEEFTSLLESGLEYVSDYNGLKVLRGRK